MGGIVKNNHIIDERFKGRHVLVTGGTGFIGGAIVTRLLTAGAYVRATHFKTPPRISHPNLTWINADLTSSTDCTRVVENIEIVIMAAASTSGAAAIVGTPLVHLTPNVIMNSQMLEAAYLGQVTGFLFISSATVYEPNGNIPLSEDQALVGNPADVYFIAGWMKRYTEILCNTYAQHLDRKMAMTVVRPSNVYGPGDKFDWQTSHVTAATIRKVIERQNPIVVWGDGETRRDLIYIDDFVEGTLRALLKNEPFYCVNIASGLTVSIRELLDTAISVDGIEDATITFDSARPQTVQVLTIDVTKSVEELDFRPSVSLADGIHRTISWYRKTLSGERA
jgi:GDP-L-fucose synthase